METLWCWAERSSKWRSAWVVVGLVTVACDEPCDRSGCDAMNRIGDSTGQSEVTGFVAYSSDVIANDCQECGFAETTLEFWHTDAELTDIEAAQVLAASRPADQTVTATHQYRQSLEPRSYLMCAGGYDCVAFAISPGMTTTLNLRMTEGPTRFCRSQPGSKSLEPIMAWSFAR